MDLDRDLGPIASNVRIVFQSFRTLFNTATSEDNAEDLSTFEEESTRFKMWAGNLGAHQSGRVSLDYRLREALHLQEQVVYLLKDISDSLQDAVSLVCQEQLSWQKTRESQDLEEDMITFLGEPRNGESSDELSDFDENESPGTGLSLQCADVSEAIDCLLRLSVAIANPAPHEKLRKLRHGASEDVSFYETHDIGYVQDKYPNISTGLAEMLGKTITRRRQFFKYREAQRAKLAAGLDMASHGQEGDIGDLEATSTTVAASLPDHLKGFEEVDIRSGTIDEDDLSETGTSQTSCATSSGILLEGIDEDALMKKPSPILKFPPATEQHGLDVITLTNKPSIDATYLEIFVRTSASYQVALGRLLASTVGINGNDMSLNNTGTLGPVIFSEHLPTAAEEHLNAIVALSRKPTREGIATECPFCHHNISELKDYVRHVGNHLEQLALFSLPINDGVDDEAASDDEIDTLSQQDPEKSAAHTPESSGRHTSVQTEKNRTKNARAIEEHERRRRRHLEARVAFEDREGGIKSAFKKLFGGSRQDDEVIMVAEASREAEVQIWREERKRLIGEEASAKAEEKANDTATAAATASTPDASPTTLKPDGPEG
ncbi:hypothetical protein FDECE_3835 [Fusarium decemcellulare]|nr:hypothetical protein FDECE_3835 [Fusarium decemcellulare]